MAEVLIMLRGLDVLLSVTPRFLFGLLALLSRDDLLPEVTLLVDAVDMTLSAASSVKLLILESAFKD
jgi:hypothetical protein